MRSPTARRAATLPPAPRRGRPPLAAMADEPCHSELGDGRVTDCYEPPLLRCADHLGDFPEHCWVAKRPASELHHRPPAAEDGLAAAGHHDPEIVIVQVPELWVRT